jgi:hypothetical protein
MPGWHHDVVDGKRGVWDGGWPEGANTSKIRGL